MKSDMAQCLAKHAYRYEEDRGDRKGEKRREARLGLDNLPSRERMRPSNRRYRGLDTGILRSFLLSGVGQSWDEVYSEVCQHNHLSNFKQWELRRELESLVERNAVIINGQPCGPDGLRIYSDFWVHPQSGILMGVDLAPRYRWKRRTLFRQVPIDNWHKYIELEGIWYKVSFAPIPVAPEELGFDIFFRERIQIKQPAPAHNKPLSFSQRLAVQNCRKYVNEWGGLIYAVSRRQLNKKEVHKIRKQLES